MNKWETYLKKTNASKNKWNNNMSLWKNNVDTETKVHGTWFDATIQYGTLRYDTMLCDTVRYVTIQCDTIRYVAIQYDTNVSMRQDSKDNPAFLQTKSIHFVS